jgi:hypothetical protein
MFLINMVVYLYKEFVDQIIPPFCLLLDILTARTSFPFYRLKN